MTTQQTTRFARLDWLLTERERVRGETAAIASDPSPWCVGLRYFASSQDASVERGRQIDALMHEAERLDEEIVDERDFLNGWGIGGEDDLDSEAA